MNVCLYVPYRIVNHGFDNVMIFSKVVAHEPGRVFKLVGPISTKITKNELNRKLCA